MKNKILSLLVLSAFIVPNFAFALQIPVDAQVENSVSAQAYIVKNIKTGEVIFSKNADQVLIPASLTKLVTALVVLDRSPNLSKTVTMTSTDQIAGWCKAGGVCITSKGGVKFTLDGLFHATVIKSANNAANALARSTGLTQKQFVAKMNAKAKALGATNSTFYEPTGMDPRNRITADDYAKIITAAYTNPYLRDAATQTSYELDSTNNSNYNQLVKTADKLLLSGDVQILGSKTGYLTESHYNYATLAKASNGDEFAVVTLGEPHLYSAFADTKTIMDLLGNATLAYQP